VVMTAAFVWFWFPGLMFQALSYFTWGWYAYAPLKYYANVWQSVG
jgi:hypothetical protein